MFERILRSFGLVRASWGILMQDKKLLVFPVLSGIVTLLVIISFILPLVLTGQAAHIATTTAGSIVLLFLFYLVSYVVVIFFNTALISCVHARIEGRAMTIGEGLAIAARHIVPILAWAFIAATVGLVLHMIQERSGLLGRIAAAIAGGVWSLVTMFVVPVMVFEDKGVFAAMRESLGLFRKTWGESIAGSISIGLVFAAVGMAGFLVVMAVLFTANLAAMAIAVALFILLIAVLAILSSAMNGIFVVALYTYARTGTVPAPYPDDLVRNAFTLKPGTI